MTYFILSDFVILFFKKSILNVTFQYLMVYGHLLIKLYNIFFFIIPIVSTVLLS